MREDSPPARALHVSRVLYERLVRHLRAAAPCEGVGLLAVVSAGGRDGAVAFYPGTNIEASSTRYTMDPAEVVAALQEMDDQGWQLGAIVHSHPASPPVPSMTDRRQAFYPDALLLIVGLASDPPVPRAWRTFVPPSEQLAAVEEVPVIIEASPGTKPVRTNRTRD